MDAYKERIRPLFDKLGLQDKQIEELFDLPRGVIYKWGTGNYKSYRNYLYKFAPYFHVSIDYLLGATDDPIPPGEAQKEKPPAQGGELSPLDKRLNKLLLVASDDTKRLMIGLLERLQTQSETFL